MRLTGSGSDRARKCIASTILPHTGNSSDAAEWGSTGHRYLQRITELGGDADAALLEMPEKDREKLAQIQLDKLPLTPTAKAEGAYAYDALTGLARLIGYGIERNYGPLGPYEIAASNDLEDIQGEHGFIYDYKFHMGPDSYTSDPERNNQLKTLALMFATVNKLSKVTIGLRKIGPDGEVTGHHLDVTLDAFDLADYALETKKLVESIAKHEAEFLLTGKMPPTVTGKHCHWCPALKGCPAVVGTIQVLGNGPLAVAEQIRNALTPETATVAYHRFRFIKQVVGEVGSALAMYARENPINLENGMVYGARESSRPELDGNKAFRIIAAEYGPDVAAKACEMSTSKAAIRRALDPVAKETGQPLAALERGVLAKIANAGGVTTKTTERVEEHKA